MVVPPPFPLGCRHQFLGIDLDDFRDNLEKALAIIQEVRRRQLTVNGIVPSEKKYVALATLVAIFLGKSANSYESVSLAQSRLLTQQKILVDEFNKLTFEARKFSYGVAVFAINCLQSKFGELRWLSPASGWYNTVMVKIAFTHSYQVVLGSIFPFDTHISSTWFSSKHILFNASPGSIIVLHDNGSQGERRVSTLEKVLPELSKKGYRIITLSELFAS